jgi:pyruvate formate lyase activating enzyme
MTPDEVYAEAAKDRHYYARSGGGVTLSGGEPLMRPAFIGKLLDLLGDNGIETTIETALCVPWRNIERVAARASRFLVDIKHGDSAVHKTLTGAGNEPVIENLGRLSMIHRGITIRIPLIPGVNDDNANIAATVAIINRAGPGVTTVEPLPYNDLYGGKYESLGTPMKYPDLKPQGKRRIDGIKAALRGVLRPDITVV